MLKNKLIWTALLATPLLFPGTAMAQAGETDAVEITLWGMFLQGGWAMYPLALFSMLLVGLAIYCGVILREKLFSQPDTVAALREAIEADDLDAARNLCAEADGYLTPILDTGLKILGEGHRRPDEINTAMEERAAKVLAGPLVFVQYLQVIASVSPMLGLLGTVSGMVKAFRNIAAQGLGKPELLANNISEALVTTATGLLIAIPALMAYFYFKNRYSRVSAGIYESLGDLTRLMTRRGWIDPS